IAEVVARWTGIPVTRLMESERQKLLKLESHLHQKVIGQGEAVTAVAAAIRRSRAGMSDPGRPIGSFLFMGPTGVGKTELARALAALLFDSEDTMVRLDMSEYMEKQNVFRLIGAPPGYVGYEAGGQLTDSVRRHPYSVLLFDEVEKAHPDVFNVLLQVLDDGRLTDGQGHVVDFSNTIIVMTSNIGSQYILECVGDGIDADKQHQKMRDRVMGALQKHFRPEFLNRMDDIILFDPLSKAEIREIVGIQMKRVERLLGNQGMAIELSDDAQTYLAEVGYDPVYGARPLKRAIQREVENPIATKILENVFTDGDAIAVAVETNDDDAYLTFTRIPRPEPEPPTEPDEPADPNPSDDGGSGPSAAGEDVPPEVMILENGGDDRDEATAETPLEIADEVRAEVQADAGEGIEDTPLSGQASDQALDLPEPEEVDNDPGDPPTLDIQATAVAAPISDEEIEEALQSKNADGSTDGSATLEDADIVSPPPLLRSRDDTPARNGDESDEWAEFDAEFSVL
ncbi:MAG: AAA family ATPase, partial [Cyanobacteria bacterium P01_H01_bin.130]